MIYRFVLIKNYQIDKIPRCLLCHNGSTILVRFILVVCGKKNNQQAVRHTDLRDDHRRTASPTNHHTQVKLIKNNRIQKKYYTRILSNEINFVFLATVFGDPHFITFDDVEYTFNGKGEFVLVHADTNKHKLDVQARFQQVNPNIYGPVMATQLTSIVGTYLHYRLRKF